MHDVNAIVLQVSEDYVDHLPVLKGSEKRCAKECPGKSPLQILTEEMTPGRCIRPAGGFHNSGFVPRSLWRRLHTGAHLREEVDLCIL
jgi:hypothetical protein